MSPGANQVAGAPASTVKNGIESKTDIYRRIAALKNGVTAASIIGFGAMTGMVSAHGVSSTSVPASASGATPNGQYLVPQSQDDRGFQQNQYGNGTQGNQGYGRGQNQYGFGSGDNQAPIAHSGTS